MSYVKSTHNANHLVQQMLLGRETKKRIQKDCIMSMHEQNPYIYLYISQKVLIIYMFDFFSIC